MKEMKEMKTYNKGIPCETLPAITGIYLITNLINSKNYVGQSVNIRKRIQEHCRSAQPEKYAIKSKRDSLTPIHLAMRKYGINNFKVEILEECSKDKLNDCEKFWISTLDSNNSEKGYNLTSGGQGNSEQKRSNHSQSKLTELEVLEIKEMLANSQLTLEQIAKVHNKVKASMICLINTGKAWHDENRDYPIRKEKHKFLGQLNPNALFTDDQAMDIRLKYSQGASLKEIFNEYTCYATERTIKAIIYGESFQHLPVWNRKSQSWEMKRVSTIS